MFFEAKRDTKRYYSQRDNICPTHFHRSVEALYVHKGEKEVLIDGKPYLLHEGDLLVCPPYTVHTYLPSDGEQIVAVFSADLCQEFEQFCKAQTPQTHVVKDEDGTFEKLIRALKEPCNEAYYRGVVNCLLGLYQAKTPFSPSKNFAEKSIVAQIAEYVDEHYAEPITLSSLAKRFGYAPNYFSALFKKFFRSGIAQYINSVRVQKSVKLLRKQKVSGVYAAVGFQSPQQYFLNFKRVYGCTPKTYLKM